MEYLERMKTMQNAFLEFIDNENSFDDLTSLLNSQKAHKDIHELKSILYLISKISQNHHRVSSFFEKIKNILDFLKSDIKQSFSNIEIFNIFKKNKRVLLLLFEEGILGIDEFISEQLTDKDYFYPEIHKFAQMTAKNYEIKELPDHFEEKRLIGENDSYLCEIIRNDQIEDFIINFNKHLFSLTMNIEPSIFETNSFLIKRNPTIIEYTLFFGSIQIFQFLCNNNVKLEPSSWIYAIHGRNPEIIQYLEENKILPKDQTYNECLRESIKCHHNDFATYFINKYLNMEEKKPKNYNWIHTMHDESLTYHNDENYFGFHFYNFEFISEDIKDKMFFFYAVDYDYYKLVDYYKNIEGLDINELVILMVYLNLIQNAIQLALEKNNLEIFNYLLKLPEFRIGFKCFSYCSKLEKFVIPSFITIIDTLAFDGCENLTEIKIPSSVTTIEGKAFQYCSSLAEINIPSSVEIINEEVFLECISITKIEIPNSVKQIGKSSFKNCKLLNSITLPSSLISIEENLFEGCSSLTKIVIPSSVESINQFAFYKCKSLKEVNIPSSVKTIKSCAFNGCSSLELVLFESNSKIVVIDSYVFENCLSLRKIEIPSSVKLIKCFAFKNCKSLNEIVIDPSIQQIQNNVFDGCESLDLNSIPSSKQMIKIPIDVDPIKMNVVILGSFLVGKKSIVRRYARNEFYEDHVSMIGSDFLSKIVDIDGNQVKLQIYWMTSDRYNRILSFSNYARHAHCAIIVFDLTEKESLIRAIDYYNALLELKCIFPIAFFGNKCDLENQKIDNDMIEKLKQFERSNNSKYFEVSAKTNKNIDDAFKYVVTEAFYQFIPEEALLQNNYNDTNVKPINIENTEKKNSKC